MAYSRGLQAGIEWRRAHGLLPPTAQDDYLRAMTDTINYDLGQRKDAQEYWRGLPGAGAAGPGDAGSMGGSGAWPGGEGGPLGSAAPPQNQSQVDAWADPRRPATLAPIAPPNAGALSLSADPGAGALARVADPGAAAQDAWVGGMWPGSPFEPGPAPKPNRFKTTGFVDNILGALPPPGQTPPPVDSGTDWTSGGGWSGGARDVLPSTDAGGGRSDAYASYTQNPGVRAGVSVPVPTRPSQENTARVRKVQNAARSTVGQTSLRGRGAAEMINHLSFLLDVVTDPQAPFPASERAMKYLQHTVQLLAGLRPGGGKKAPAPKFITYKNMLGDENVMKIDLATGLAEVSSFGGEDTEGDPKPWGWVPFPGPGQQ